MEDVIISMQSVQNYDDEEDTNTLNFMTDGKYTYDHDVGCLTYEESEVFGPKRGKKRFSRTIRLTEGQ